MKDMKGRKKAEAKSKAKSIHRRDAEDAEKSKTWKRQNQEESIHHRAHGEHREKPKKEKAKVRSKAIIFHHGEGKRKAKHKRDLP